MIAELVLEKGWATAEEVAACQREQKRLAGHGQYKPLVLILVERGLLTKERAEEASRELDFREARDEDREIGEVAWQAGIIPRERVEECLAAQRDAYARTGEIRRLGLLLAERGYATPEKAVAILEAREKAQAKVSPADAAKRPVRRSSSALVAPKKAEAPAGARDDLLFARLALQRNLITREQLREALMEQAVAARYGEYVFLGDLLREKGFVTPEQWKALVAVEETTKVLRQDLLFAKTGLRIGKLVRDHVDGALSEQRAAVEEGRTPVPRLGEILLRRGWLTAPDSVAILAATEALEEKLLKKRGPDTTRRLKPDLPPLPGTRKADRVFATLLVRRRLLDADAVLRGFREQPDAERAGTALPIGKVLEGLGVLATERRREAERAVAEEILACGGDECDGYVERSGLAGRSAPCPKCGLLLVESEEVVRLRPSDRKPAVEPASEPASGPAADRLGEYLLVRELGRGASGVVYEALQESLQRRVALKVLLDESTLDQKSVERFRREAESAMKLRHENIVPILDVGELDGVSYYTMAYVEGRSLDEILTERAIEPERAVRIAAQVARALEHAHGRGLVHGGIRPGNLLVDKTDRVHLTDFGLTSPTGDSTAATRSVLETPVYTAPERLAGRTPATPASDVYALGVTLYEALAGEPPFKARNVADLAVQIRDTNPPRPSKKKPGVPGPLDRVVLQAISKNPEDRYASAGGMAEDLERFLRGEKVKAGGGVFGALRSLLGR